MPLHFGQRSVPDIEKLRHAPVIHNRLVGDDVAAELQKIKLVPTLCFIDPFGYKGLSLRLINAVLKDFGCECLFFFNYNHQYGSGKQAVRDRTRFSARTESPACESASRAYRQIRVNSLS